VQGLLVLRQDFVLEDAIGSQACSLEANMRASNGIPLELSLSCQLTLLQPDTDHELCHHTDDVTELTLYIASKL